MNSVAESLGDDLHEGLVELAVLQLHLDLDRFTSCDAIDEINTGAAFILDAAELFKSIRVG